MITNIRKMLSSSNTAVIADKKALDDWSRGNISSEQAIHYMMLSNRISNVSITVSDFETWANSIGYHRVKK
jgi:hypothetical protein